MESQQLYRIDLVPAIRLIVTLPKGKSVTAVAAKCVDLTEAEIKRLGAQGLAVDNLSPKWCRVRLLWGNCAI